jgi:glutaredoxin
MSAFKSLLFCAVIALALPCAAQTTYRWIAPGGETVYSDQPPPTGVNYEKLEGYKQENDPQLPYATRQAMGKYPVTLYTTASCKESCAKARTLLNGRGIPFSEKMLTNPEEIAEITAQMGTESFIPGIKVGSQNLPGYEANAWNNLLDLAGYPKTAPYGSKPSGVFSR